MHAILQLPVVNRQQPSGVIHAHTMQPMVVDRRTFETRLAFSGRLRDALCNAFGEASEGKWAKSLTRKGITVSQQGLHKWLAGHALPSQDKWVALAHALGQQVSWLRDGEANPGMREQFNGPVELRDDQRELLIEWEALEPTRRAALRALMH